MEVKVTQKKLKSEDYVALFVQAKGIPDRTITIHLDALADGRTTIEKEVRKAKDDAEVRMVRAETARKSLKELENL